MGQLERPPEEVDAGLRALAALSREPPRAWTVVDMSPDAVDARLRECADISALALQLMRAGVGLREGTGE